MLAQPLRLPLQRGLDPANTKAWDWYDKESHRKDASYLETVGAAKGAAGDVAKALAATGVPKTDEARERFEKQVQTLIRLNAVAMVADHRAGLVRRQSQFESMLSSGGSGTPPTSAGGPGAPTAAKTAAADTAAAVRGAAEVVRKLNDEQESLVKLKNTASSAVRVNDGPEAIPSDYDTLLAAAQPRSTPAMMQSVLTINDRMEGLSYGSKKLRLMELGNEIARLRERQISGVRQGLASLYDAFPGQVVGQVKDALDRQTVASASTSPDKSLLGVSAPSMFEWAIIGVTAALTAFDLGMAVKEIAALKPRFSQEPHVGGQPKERAGGPGAGSEPGPPKAPADPAAPNKPSVGTPEARVLEAGRGDAVPSLEQIDSELAIVERSEPRASNVKGYQDEVELGNGHTWRRDANDNWCRFSDPRICVPHGKGKAKVGDGVVRSEQDLDALVAGSRPRLDQPAPSVVTPEDARLWELYNSYFDERVATMRADLRSELGATKREPPLTFDGFRERYTKTRS
jgi:hypothetical protein